MQIIKVAKFTYLNVKCPPTRNCTRIYIPIYIYTCILSYTPPKYMDVGRIRLKNRRRMRKIGGQSVSPCITCANGQLRYKYALDKFFSGGILGVYTCTVTQRSSSKFHHVALRSYMHIHQYNLLYDLVSTQKLSYYASGKPATMFGAKYVCGEYQAKIRPF